MICKVSPLSLLLLPDLCKEPVLWAVRTAQELQYHNQLVLQASRRMERQGNLVQLQFMFWNRPHHIHEYEVQFQPPVEGTLDRIQCIQQLDFFLGTDRMYDGHQLLWLPHAW